MLDKNFRNLSSHIYIILSQIEQKQSNKYNYLLAYGFLRMLRWVNIHFFNKMVKKNLSKIITSEELRQSF